MVVHKGAVHREIPAEAFARASGLDLRTVMSLLLVEVDDTLAAVLGEVRHGSAAVGSAHYLASI